MSAKDAAGFGQDRRVEVLVSVAEDACRTATAQYDDYYRSFVGLDGKAQSAATVGGVVMGAVLAFINAAHFDALISKGGSWGHVAVLAPAVGALITVLLSLITMWVRAPVVPLAADQQIAEAEDLAGAAADAISSEHVLRYYRGRLNHSKEALADISGHVDQKGRWLIGTQVALASTLISLLVLFVMVVETSITAAALP